MIALRRFLQVLGAGLLCAATGCSDDGKTGQTPPSFAIIPPLSSFYRVTVAEEAAEGDPVRFTVALTDEEAHILSVRYNDRDCRLLSADERLREYVYGFTMPDEEVSLSVKVRKGPDEEPEDPEDPESETYGLVCEDSELYTFSGVPERAEPEQRIRFSLTVHTLPERILSLRSAEYCDARTGESLGECQVSEEKEAVPDGVRYDLLFRMPEADVVLKADVEELFGLTLRGDEHAGAVLADPGAFPTAGEGYAIPAGESVRFSIRTEPGYEAEYTLTGDRSGTPYEAVEVVGKDGYREFSMPGEPVTIAVASRESSRYEGEFFVGEYKGYLFPHDKSGIYPIVAPTMSLSLRENGAFGITSTDGHRLNFAGNYEFDIPNNHFESLPDRQAEYAFEGEWKEEISLLCVADSPIRANLLSEGRFYLLPKEEISELTVAIDYWWWTGLMEFKTADGQIRHYFIHFRPGLFHFIPGETEFIVGSSLRDSFILAVFTPENARPQDSEFEFAYSAEDGIISNSHNFHNFQCGEYHPQSGSGDILTLGERFRATLGQRKGCYLIDWPYTDGHDMDIAIVFICDGKRTSLLLDTVKRTYSVIDRTPA